jgi:hypothetical protein
MPLSPPIVRSTSRLTAMNEPYTAVTLRRMKPWPWTNPMSGHKRRGEKPSRPDT